VKYKIDRARKRVLFVFFSNKNKVGKWLTLKSNMIQSKIYI
jgi:hypothetical protein